VLGAAMFMVEIGGIRVRSFDALFIYKTIILDINFLTLFYRSFILETLVDKKTDT